jgi:hypothetical protein
LLKFILLITGKANSPCNVVIGIADQLPLPIKYPNFMDLFKFAMFGLEKEPTSSLKVFAMLQAVISRVERTHKAKFFSGLLWPSLSKYLVFDNKGRNQNAIELIKVLTSLSCLHDALSTELYQLGVLSTPVVYLSEAISSSSSGSISISDDVIVEASAILEFVASMCQDPEVISFARTVFSPSWLLKMLSSVSETNADFSNESGCLIRSKLLSSLCSLFSLLYKAQKQTPTASSSRSLEVAEFLRAALTFCHSMFTRCSYTSSSNPHAARSTLVKSPYINLIEPTEPSAENCVAVVEDPKLICCKVLVMLSRSYSFSDYSELKDAVQTLRTCIFARIDESEPSEYLNELEYVDALSAVCGYRDYCWVNDHIREDDELLLHSELVKHVATFTGTNSNSSKDAVSAAEAASPSTAISEAVNKPVPACGDVNCCQAGCAVCSTPRSSATDSFRSSGNESISHKRSADDLIAINVKYASSSSLPMMHQTLPTMKSSPGAVSYAAVPRGRSRSFDAGDISAMKAILNEPGSGKEGYLSASDMFGAKYVGVKLLLKYETEIRETMEEWATAASEKVFHLLTVMLIIGQTNGFGSIESLVDIPEFTSTVLLEILTDERLGLESYPQMLPKILHLFTYIASESAPYQAGDDVAKATKLHNLQCASAACDFAIGLFSNQDYWGNDDIMYASISLIIALCPHDRNCRRAVVKSFAKLYNAFTRRDRVNSLQPLLKMLSRVNDCVGKIDVNGESEGIEALLALLVGSLRMYKCNYHDLCLAACKAVGDIGAEYPGLAHRVFMRRELEDLLALFLKQGGIGHISRSFPLHSARQLLNGSTKSDFPSLTTVGSSKTLVAPLSNPHIVPVLRACIVCIKDVHSNPFWQFTAFGPHWLAYAEGLPSRPLLNAQALQYIAALTTSCDVRYRLLVLTAALEYATALMFNCCDGNLSKPFMGQDPAKVIDFATELKQDLIKYLLPLIPKSLNIIISRDNNKVISVNRQGSKLVASVPDSDPSSANADTTAANPSATTVEPNTPTVIDGDENAETAVGEPVGSPTQPTKKKSGLMKSMKSSLAGLTKNPFSKKKDKDKENASALTPLPEENEVNINGNGADETAEAGVSSGKEGKKKSALSFSKEILYQTNKLFTGGGGSKPDRRTPTSYRNSVSSIRPSLYRSWSATSETTVNRALEQLTEKTVDAIYSFFCLQDMYPVSVYLMNITLFERTPICACLAYSMSSYPENFIIQQRGIEIFRTFAENKTELSSLGMHASTALLIALKKFDDHSKLQISYCKIIKILAASDDFARDNLIRYSVQNGLASILMKNNAEVSLLALQALRGLIVTPSEANCVCEGSNIIGAVVRALDYYANDLSIQIEGLFALIELSETEEFGQAMSADNAESILKKSRKTLTNTLKIQKPLPRDYKTEDIQEILDNQQLAVLSDKCTIA